MAGRAAERRRIVVVDLAGQCASAPRIVVHRPYVGAARAAEIGVELKRERVGPANAADHHVRELLWKRRAAALFGDEAEQNEPEVAVNRSRPRLVLERDAADLVLEFAPRRRRRIDQPRRKP